jgi:hypothetical protein
MSAVREAVGIAFQAIEQQPRRLLCIGSGRLPRSDPVAVKKGDEHREVAARVIEFLGLLVAAGEEGVVEARRSTGVGPEELGELTGDGFEARDELPGSAVRDEPSWLECELDRALQRVSPSWAPLAMLRSWTRLLCGHRAADRRCRSADTGRRKTPAP